MSCCCDADACVICADNFNRGDSSDISTGSSCGWTEESGAWEINTNRLRVTTAGIATSNTNASGVPSLYITVKVRADTANDTARVVVNFEDTSNYDYAEVKFSATAGHLKLFEVISGTHTELETSATNLNVALNTDHDLIVCLRSGKFVATLTHGGTSTTESTDLDGQADSKAGLASGTTVGNVEFDDWSLEKNRAVSSGCNDCLTATLTTCNDCISGEATNRYLVTIDNIIDSDFCPECKSDWEGSYIFEIDAFCGDTQNLTGTPCVTDLGTLNLTLDLDTAGSTDTIRATFSYSITSSRNHTINYIINTSGGVDCMNLTDTLMTFESELNGASGCDWSSAEVRITTLPSE